jgi:hypothetical protein
MGRMEEGSMAWHRRRAESDVGMMDSVCVSWMNW